MKGKITGVKPRDSKYGGVFYHIFFKNEYGSYRTCIDPKNRNWQNWKDLISSHMNGEEVILDGLAIKKDTLIDADSPVRKLHGFVN